MALQKTLKKQITILALVAGLSLAIWYYFSAIVTPEAPLNLQDTFFVVAVITVLIYTIEWLWRVIMRKLKSK